MCEVGCRSLKMIHNCGHFIQPWGPGKEISWWVRPWLPLNLTTTLIFHKGPHSRKVGNQVGLASKPAFPGVHHLRGRVCLPSRCGGWELGLLVFLEPVRRHLQEIKNPSVQQPRPAARREALRGGESARGALLHLNHAERVRRWEGWARDPSTVKAWLPSC